MAATAKPTSISLSPRELELVDRAAEHLNQKRSEFTRRVLVAAAKAVLAQRRHVLVAK